MLIKGLVEEDFVNYKKPSMFIIFPTCTFKCDKEFGNHICQNSSLIKAKDIEISYDSIVKKYINNPISKSIIMGGLEPFDSYMDLYNLIREFRKVCDDDIIIYTGYTFEELRNIDNLKISGLKNIIIKFGRFIPNQTSHYDELLGIKLASDNQYARRMS